MKTFQKRSLELAELPPSDIARMRVLANITLVLGLVITIVGIAAGFLASFALALPAFFLALSLLAYRIRLLQKMQGRRGLRS